MPEDGRLSLSRRRAMAAHRGKYERLHPVIAPVLNDALHDRGNVRYAAAADANRDARGWSTSRGEARLLELTPRLCTDIGQSEVGEMLADEKQAGWQRRRIARFGHQERRIARGGTNQTSTCDRGALTLAPKRAYNNRSSYHEVGQWRSWERA
jgi:hypothetical protein